MRNNHEPRLTGEAGQRGESRNQGRGAAERERPPRRTPSPPRVATKRSSGAVQPRRRARLRRTTLADFERSRSGSR
jgi:hypothetical protein